MNQTTLALRYHAIRIITLSNNREDLTDIHETPEWIAECCPNTKSSFVRGHHNTWETLLHPDNDGLDVLQAGTGGLELGK